MRHRHANQFCCSIVVVLAILASPMPSQASDALVEAKSLLRSLYPELIGKRYGVIIRDDSSFDQSSGPSSFHISLYRAGSENPCERPELAAFFTFAVRGDKRLYRLSVSGPVVNESKNQEIRKLVQAHPEWTVEQVNEAVKKSGARFGLHDKEALRRILPLTQLEVSLGDLRVTEVDFQVSSETERSEGLPAADLLWVVRVQATKNKRASRYYLGFEPFEGKLVSLGRVP